MSQKRFDLQQTINAYLERGNSTGWFEELYMNAGRDPQAIPWARLSARRELLNWADRRHLDGSGRSAIVIGCGLGDDAEFLADRGYRVTAFDISASAVDWCKERFSKSSVDYQVADMFNPPDEWLNAFDLVVEAFIVQALPPELRRQSIEAVAAFVAPGGALLAIGIGVEEGYERSGPPWPLFPTELALYEQCALELVELLRDDDPAAPQFRYWAEYRRHDLAQDGGHA